jgi:hypothetical protein
LRTLARLSPRGEVAQLVEHTAENRGVAGSSPALAIPGRTSSLGDIAPRWKIALGGCCKRFHKHRAFEGDTTLIEGDVRVHSKEEGAAWLSGAPIVSCAQPSVPVVVSSSPSRPVAGLGGDDCVEGDLYRRLPVGGPGFRSENANSRPFEVPVETRIVVPPAGVFLVPFAT